MEYILHADFHTDGDYSIDKSVFNRLREEHEDEVFYDEGLENFSIYIETKDFYLVRDCLETMAKSFHVNHYWLIKDLFNLCDKTLEALRDKDTFEHTEYLGGNYDGTVVSLKKIGNEVKVAKEKNASTILVLNKLQRALMKYYERTDEVDYCRSAVLCKDVEDIIVSAAEAIGKLGVVESEE